MAAVDPKDLSIPDLKSWLLDVTADYSEEIGQYLYRLQIPLHFEEVRSQNVVLMKRRARSRDSKTVVVQTSIDNLPEKVRAAMLRAIDLVKRYELPCDVAITDLEGTTARHGWRKDGTCSILFSFNLVQNGDSRAVHRRIIHEAAHHIAGLEHLDHDDERFRRIAAALYECEGYPRGKPGDHCGNM